MKDRYEFDAVIHELKDRGGAYVRSCTNRGKSSIMRE